MAESAPDVNRSQFDLVVTGRSGLIARMDHSKEQCSQSQVRRPSRKPNEGGAYVWLAQVFEHPQASVESASCPSVTCAFYKRNPDQHPRSHTIVYNVAASRKREVKAGEYIDFRD
jgi:hypothetical protein